MLTSISGVVHGDLKPENVLLCWENTNTVSAKVADFGFSSLASSEDLMFLPQSRPWYAPEWHHRGFTIEEAKRQDSYSFGLLCLWFLLSNGEDPQKEKPFTDDGTVSNEIDFDFRPGGVVEDMKQSDHLLHRAIQAVQNLQVDDETQRHALESLFHATLEFEPLKRTWDFQALSRLLWNPDSPNERDITLEHAGKVLRPPDSNFEVFTKCASAA